MKLAKEGSITSDDTRNFNKMAAISGSGVDWVAVQKALVSASQGSHSTFRSSDVPLLLDTILERYCYVFCVSEIVCILL